MAPRRPIICTAKGAYCVSVRRKAVPARARSRLAANPDFNVSQLGVVTRWTPVKNLTFSAEVDWFHLDQKYTGTSTFSAGSPKPAATYEFKDQNTVLLQVRAQRNF